jgi:crossover junction endodeoxyribonuclease RuvC
MIFLGIDIGFDRCGFCVLETEDKFKNPKIITAGCITTDRSLSISKRLDTLNQDLLTLKEKYKPSFMSIEKLFFNRKNTAFEKVCMAKGIALMLFNESQILEIEPNTVKGHVIGSGRATKAQMRPILEKILSMDLSKIYDDTIDAICLGLYQVDYEKLNQQLANSN